MLPSSFRNYWINMDYGCNLNSGIVLIPGLSLLVQRIQVNEIVKKLQKQLSSTLDPLSAGLNLQFHMDKKVSDPDMAKIDKIYRWHMIGSFFQLMVSSIALKALNQMPGIGFKKFIALTGFVVSVISLTKALHGYNKVTWGVDDNTKQFFVSR